MTLSALRSIREPQVAGFLSELPHSARPGFLLSLTRWLWPIPNANRFIVDGVTDPPEAQPLLSRLVRLFGSSALLNTWRLCIRGRAVNGRSWPAKHSICLVGFLLHTGIVRASSLFPPCIGCIPSDFRPALWRHSSRPCFRRTGLVGAYFLRRRRQGLATGRTGAHWPTAGSQKRVPSALRRGQALSGETRLRLRRGMAQRNLASGIPAMLETAGFDCAAAVARSEGDALTSSAGRLER